MKNLACYAFLSWLILITSVYIYIPLVWLKNPHIKSLYDNKFYLVIAGAMIFIPLVSAILKKKGHTILLFSASLLSVFVLVIPVLSKTIIDIAAFLWVFILSCLIGRKIIRMISKELPLSWLENGILSAALGFGFHSFLMFGLSIAGFLYREIVFSILILISIMFMKETVLFFREAHIEIKKFPFLLRTASDKGFVSALLSIILISVLINFIGAVAPDIQYDALNYHLMVPRIYIENHKMIELPHILQSYFAKSIEMLYTLGLILSGQITAKMFSFAFGILGMVAIITFSTRFFSFEAGIVAAALFYVCPIVAWFSTTTYIDLAVAFYTFAAVYALTLWWKTDCNGFILLCGLLSGLALSAKLNAVLILIPLVLSVIAINYHRSGKSLSKQFPPLAIFGIAVVIVAMPWYFITYLHTGNPIFPFYNKIFKSPLWPLENTFFNKEFGMGYGFKDFLLLPWNLTYNTKAFIESAPNGSMGLALLIAAPSVFLLRLKSSGIVPLLFLICVGFIGIWFIIGQYLRFFLIILPLLSVLSAYTLLNFQQVYLGVINHVYKGIIIAGLISTAPLSLVIFWNIPERIPYKVAFGIESSDEYLARVFRGYYYAFKHLEKDKNPEKVKVLLLGNPFLYYSNVYMENIIASLTAGEIRESSPGDMLSKLLLNKGFTHILIDKALTSTWSWKPAVSEASFLGKFTSIEFTSGDIYIYKILKVGPSTNGKVFDKLLENHGVEEINGKGAL
jgi:hypothetical protein